jgi:hypothetical protein
MSTGFVARQREVEVTPRTNAGLTKSVAAVLLAAAVGGGISGCGLAAPTTYNEGVELVVTLYHHPVNPTPGGVRIAGPGEFPLLAPTLNGGESRKVSYGRRPVGSTVTFRADRGTIDLETVTCTVSTAYQARTPSVVFDNNAIALTCVGW